LHKVRDRVLVSVFHMWKSSFPNTICWRGCLFSYMFLALLSKFRCLLLHGLISGSSTLLV
jgi:hypothetical protein